MPSALCLRLTFGAMGKNSKTCGQHPGSQHSIRGTALAQKHQLPPPPGPMPGTEGPYPRRSSHSPEVPFGGHEETDRHSSGSVCDSGNKSGEADDSKSERVLPTRTVPGTLRGPACHILQGRKPAAWGAGRLGEQESNSGSDGIREGFREEVSMSCTLQDEPGFQKYK